MMAERVKYLNNNQIHKNTYFWRTKDQAEIDYVEEDVGKIDAYEFKRNNKK